MSNAVFKIEANATMRFDIKVTKEPSGVFSCYIPFYDINYDCQYTTLIIDKGMVLVDSFIRALVTRNNELNADIERMIK